MAARGTHATRHTSRRRPAGAVRQRSETNRGAQRARRNRRRALLAVAVLAVLGVGATLAVPHFQHAVNEITLPLKHEDIIRQQAQDKDLDPALIAGVIYAESRFRDATSHAGAQGLMQILPDTAQFIADRSGGTLFTTSDLSTPQVNISYGSWLLRYLLAKYDGDEMLALAAYNAGETNVNEWLTEQDATGDGVLDSAEVPFPETRHYVERVLDAAQRYRDTYARELGL